MGSNAVISGATAWRHLPAAITPHRGKTIDPGAPVFEDGEQDVFHTAGVVGIAAGFRPHLDFLVLAKLA